MKKTVIFFFIILSVVLVACNVGGVDVNSSYTISFYPNGGTGEMKAINVLKNKQTVLPQNTFTKADSSFLYWTLKADGTGDCFNDGSTVSFGSDVILYAQWKLDTLSIVFHANNGTQETKVQHVTPGQEEQLSADSFTKDGYHFIGWAETSDGEVKYADKAVVSTSKTMNLFAKWEANTYTVVFNANGGSGSQMANQDFAYDFSQNLFENSYIKTNYNFTGWAITETGEVKYTDCQNVSNLTKENEGTVNLYAIWVNESYTVIFNPNGGTPANPSSKTVIKGSTYGELATTTRDGYSFDGWFTEETGGVEINSTTDVTLVADQTLYAQWIANTYKVTFDKNGGESVNPSYKDVTYGLPYGELAEATRGGYSFTGWSSDSSGENLVTSASTVGTSADHTLYAQWTETPIKTVTFKPNYVGSTQSGYSQNVPQGIATPLTQNAFIRDGYSFTEWATNADGSGSAYGDQTDITTSTDKVLFAQWSPNTYKASFNPNGGAIGGSTAIVDETETYDSAWVLPCNPERTGYTFSGWNLSGSGVALDTSSWQFVSDKTLLAIWNGISYSVHFNANGGSGNMDNQTGFVYGTSKALSLNSFSAPGTYEFNGWSTSAERANSGVVDFADGVVVTTGTTTDGGLFDLYAGWKRKVFFYSGSNKAAIKDVKQIYGNNITSPSESQTAAVDGFTKLGWRSDTIADNKTVSFGESFTPTSLEYYGVYSRNASFNSGISKATVNSEVQYYNTNGAYKITTTNAPASIDGWTTLGWRADTTATTATISGLTSGLVSETNDSDYYAVYSRDAAITYANGGGTGETPDDTIQTQYYNTNDSITTPVFTLADNTFTREGYTFSSWDLGAEGSSYSSWIPAVSETATKTATAQWTANTITITYDSTGGSITPPDSSVTYGETYAEIANANAGIKDGFVFDGWYTESSGGTKIESDTIVSFTGNNQILYAQWVEELSITFNANGGSGTMTTQKVGKNIESTLIENGFTSPDDRIFAGWATAADASGIYYSDQDEVLISDDLTLYAIWAIDLVTLANKTEWAGDRIYSISDDLTILLRIESYSSTLVLPEGKTLTALKGITVRGYYGQSKLTITGKGELIATADTKCAGIGGINDTELPYTIKSTCGAITINGGTITAIGSGDAAGIGGALHGAGGTIIINGGTVVARASTDGGGAGIGSGSVGQRGGNVTINGGTVTATGGNGGGAGIGGGEGSSGAYVTINGGCVVANGGTSAKGIGQGKFRSSDTNEPGKLTIGTGLSLYGNATPPATDKRSDATDDYTGYRAQFMEIR